MRGYLCRSVVLSALLLSGCAELDEIEVTRPTGHQIAFVKDVLDSVRCELRIAYDTALASSDKRVRSRADQLVAAKLKLSLSDAVTPGIEATFPDSISGNLIALAVGNSEARTSSTTMELNVKYQTSQLPKCTSEQVIIKGGLGLTDWVKHYIFILDNGVEDNLGAVSYGVKFKIERKPSVGLTYNRRLTDVGGLPRIQKIAPSASGNRTVQHELTVTLDTPKQDMPKAGRAPKPVKPSAYSQVVEMNEKFADRFMSN